MKFKNSDPTTKVKNGKRSKALKIQLFEKKLRDIYSDDTVFNNPGAMLIKKANPKNLSKPTPYYPDEAQNKVVRIKKVFKPMEVNY
ncbi:MAG: hypothetical protein IPM42_15950 [Saprospiraceae bacterium]|nr:hypothetical protein [Saprospiraceae bacterium]